MSFINKEKVISDIVNTPSNHNQTEIPFLSGLGHRQNEVIDIIQNQIEAKVIEIPESGIGDLSDGYHTFNELYHHRAILFAAICNLMPNVAWKSKLHHDGEMYDGMFIVGVETPHGQATYHYDVEPYWNMFHVEELERAPEWDGHTPEQALERILTLGSSAYTVPKKMCKHCEHWLESIQWCEKFAGFIEAQNDEFYCIANCEMKAKLDDVAQSYEHVECTKEVTDDGPESYLSAEYNQ